MSSAYRIRRSATSPWIDLYATAGSEPGQDIERCLAASPRVDILP